MNRKIKFRAWDKRQEIMIPNDQVTHLEFNKDGVAWLGCWVVVADSQGEPEQGLYQVDKEDLELMQFTGLKDKNGKEIYEGDIVKTFQENYQDKNNPNVNFFVVENETEYCGALSAFTFRCLNGNYSSVHTEALSQSEIIGNIYENPELLK